VVRELLEIERKYEAGPTATVPDLQSLAGVGAIGAPHRFELGATYYDTADLRLFHAGVTLRRRSGGHDPGWHLKLPAQGDGRRELSWPLSLASVAAGPPGEVLDAVLGLVRLREVVPIATIDTIRTAYELFEADGAVLAEVADDEVVGTCIDSSRDRSSTPVVTTWREVEVEVVADLSARAAHPAVASLLLDSADTVLASAGIHRSALSSKLARVLGAESDPDPPVAIVPSTQPGRKASRTPRRVAQQGTGVTAGEVVLAYLRGQVAVLLHADLGVRTGDVEGVHDFRVTCRRLRSAMASYRSVLKGSQTIDVRAELQWIAGELSAARDQQVAIDHLRGLVLALPPDLVIGPVLERLGTSARHSHEVPQVPDVLRQHRYFALLDSLEAILECPPLTKRASRAANRILSVDVASGFARLQHRVEFAKLQTGVQRDQALHDVRKAAKRVRAAAEVAVPVAGTGKAKGLSAGGDPVAVEGLAKQVQDLLGARQDTLVTRRECQRLGSLADAVGESSWTYGVLYEREVQRAEEAEQDFWQAWRATAPNA
jgi:CHAD domain-containing protein